MQKIITTNCTGIQWLDNNGKKTEETIFREVMYKDLRNSIWRDWEFIIRNPM